MNRFYVDGAYEARGPVGAYCIVCCIGSMPAQWKLTRVEPQDAFRAEFLGLQATITTASVNLPATVFSDNVAAIKRLSDWAKRLNVELKHIPGHLAGKDDVEMTDDVKKHHWAHVQAYQCVQDARREASDSGNRIRGLDRLISKSVE